jgi:hypothetical protein
MTFPHFGQVVLRDASTFCRSIFPRGIVAEFKMAVKEKRRLFWDYDFHSAPVRHTAHCPSCLGERVSCLGWRSKPTVSAILGGRMGECGHEPNL